MMAKKIDYSIVDLKDTFTIARAANLWAGYPPAYASHSLPQVRYEPAKDQSATASFAATSSMEVLLDQFVLVQDAYDLATAMKAAIK